MSRSQICCPRCGAVLADKRRNGSVAIRPDVGMIRIGTAQTLRITCSECGTLIDWLKIRVVLFELWRV